MQNEAIKLKKNKYLIWQFMLLAFILSLPIIYLLYVDAKIYKEFYSFTESEITGLNKSKIILDEFHHLATNVPPKLSEEFKLKFSTINKLNLSLNRFQIN